MIEMSFKSFLVEKKEASYKYSSAQIDFDKNFSKQIMNFSKMISDDFIYTDPHNDSYGREDEIHITILYGLHDENPKKLKEVLKMSKLKSITIELSNISMFESDKYNVLKVDVNSKDLHYLNELIRKNSEYTNTFKDYHPHCTIAYVTKDFDISNINIEKFKGLKFEFNNIYFSSLNGSKVKISI